MYYTHLYGEIRKSTILLYMFFGIGFFKGMHIDNELDSV